MGNKGCYVINKGSLPFTSQHFRSVQFLYLINQFWAVQFSSKEKYDVKNMDKWDTIITAYL